MAEPGKGIAGATVVAVIAAIASLASAGLSAWQNQEARKLQKEIADKQQAAQELFQRQEASLRQLELDREYQLGVVERVADALEKASTAPSQVNVASALLYTLPDGDLKDRLIVVVLGEAQRAAEQGVKLDASVASLRSSVRDSAVPMAAPSLAPSPSSGAEPTGTVQPAPIEPERPSAPAQTVDLVVNPSATGWDVDVFWCQSADGGAGDANEARAKRTAERLAEISRDGESLGGERLGRVRVRELTVEANARPQYRLSTDQIFLDAGEATIGQAVAGVARAAGAPLAVVDRQGGKVSPWYLSAFYCAGG
jgi:hypothetical protein